MQSLFAFEIKHLAQMRSQQQGDVGERSLKKH